MFNFRCANALGQGGKGAMGRCMRVAAYHGHTGHGGTLLWTDNVHDALTLIQNFKLLYSKSFAVLVQGDHLF